MKGLITFLIAAILWPSLYSPVRGATHPQAEASLPQQELPPAAEPVEAAEAAEAAEPADAAEAAEASEAAAPAEAAEASEAAATPEEEQPLTVVTSDDYPYGLDGKKIFNPDPTRAVWLSALFPGLGQIYNRRYWKLPIIVAGYMGLAYGTSWNARMFQDYQLAYSDIMDDDPDTKSYLDFFAPNIDESSLDQQWLAQTLKSRKDYYRRNRDLCIICCVGLYLLCMLDAYVDASLSHFDISEDISMDLAPTMISDPGSRRPAAALNWTFTF